MRELAELLARGEPGARLDLELARDVPILRVGLMATGGLLTGQDETQFGTVGGFFSPRVFDDRLAFVLAAHYAAVGYELSSLDVIFSAAVDASWTATSARMSRNVAFTGPTINKPSRPGQFFRACEVNPFLNWPRRSSAQCGRSRIQQA